MSAKTRSHEVAAVLRTEILRNQYRPGERLPSERDLASRFETNRGAVREALKQLEQLGIIAIQPGGVRVLPKEEASLEILNYLMELEGPNLKLADEYLQIFKMLCVMCAEHTIAMANKEQLAFIESTIAKMKTDPGNKEFMREGWTALFGCFLTSSDNLVVRLIVNGLKGQLAVAMTVVDPKHTIDTKRISKILNGMNRAVKNRDSKRMGEFIGQYFEWVREITAKSFSNSQSPAAVGS
ncbi:MAG: GntR family transcriptional regulator [Cellvibrionaceae bacterium]